MRTTILLGAAVVSAAGFMLVGSPVSAGSEKVKVCHVPPGNPDNFHTITISENAVEAHLTHGDLIGSCDENCEALCNDGDLCTQDNCTEDGCDFSLRTDCNDDEECTIDSCSETLGCIYEGVAAGASCDDSKPCTYSDVCDGSGSCAGVDDPSCCYPGDPEGRCDDENECTTLDECVVPAGADKGECSNSGDVTCEAPPCSTSTCNPTTGECEDVFLCEAPDACSGVECVNEECVPTGGCEAPPCFVEVCDEMNGVCEYPPLHCPAGTVCNDQTGVCEAPASCPCWASVGFDTLENLWSALAPPNCDSARPGKDVCEEVTSSDGLQYSRANCVSVDSAYQLQTLVRDYGPSAPVGTRYRCVGIYRVPGQPPQQPIVQLSLAEFQTCLAEHDAFTATTSFPAAGAPPDRDLMCGLPYPGSL